MPGGDPTLSTTPPSPSPSEPPSPDSARDDVPLIRLYSDQTSLAPSVPTTPRRRGTPMAADQFTRVSFPSSTSGRASPTSSGGGGGLPRERKQSNPLSQFRSNRSSVSSATTLKGSTSGAGGGGGGGPGFGRQRNAYSPRLGSLAVNPKGKERYSDGPPDDDDRDNLGGDQIPGMGGRGESDGEFDEGWTGDLAEEDEIVGLLAADKVSFWLIWFGRVMVRA